MSALILLAAMLTLGYARAPIGIDESLRPAYAWTQNTSTVCDIIETCYTFLLEHQMIGTKWDLPFHFYRPSIQVLFE